MTTTVTLTKADICEVIGMKDPMMVHNNCHGVAHAIVRAGILAPPGPKTCRVARGVANGIGSQHSWIALGDPYDGDTIIVDPSGWSWEGEDAEIYSAPLRVAHQEKGYTPHGWYPDDPHIMAWGRPPHPKPGEKIIPPPEGLSREAQFFLDMVGDLDYAGWRTLLHAPLRGWPSKEIITAAAQYGPTRSIMGIDREGMATDLNPGNLYW